MYVIQNLSHSVTYLPTYLPTYLHAIASSQRHPPSSLKLPFDKALRNGRPAINTLTPQEFAYCRQALFSLYHLPTVSNVG